MPFHAPGETLGEAANRLRPRAAAGNDPYNIDPDDLLRQSPRQHRCRSLKSLSRPFQNRQALSLEYLLGP